MEGANSRDAREIEELARRLMNAAVRAAELEGMDQDDMAWLLAEPARPEHWVEIEKAFQGFRVPFDPDLKALYAITLGIQDPHAHGGTVCPPFLSASARWGRWDREDLDGFMDSLHFWPLENILDEFFDDDAFPFLVIAQGFRTNLTIGPNGKWSALAYDGEGGREPERGDFTLSLVEALRIYVDCVLEGWAYGIADIPFSDRPFGTPAGTPAPRPEAVQKAYTELLEDRDLSTIPRVRLTTHEPSYLSAAAPGVMPFDGDYEPDDDDDDSVDENDTIGIVGLPFAAYEEVSDQIRLGSAIRLVPVDDNPHDANAVEAWFDDAHGTGHRIGFIPRDWTEDVRARIQEAPPASIADVAECGPHHILIRMR